MLASAATVVESNCTSTADSNHDSTHSSTKSATDATSTTTNEQQQQQDESNTISTAAKQKQQQQQVATTESVGKKLRRSISSSTTSHHLHRNKPREPSSSFSSSSSSPLCAFRDVTNLKTENQTPKKSKSKSKKSIAAILLPGSEGELREGDGTRYGTNNYLKGNSGKKKRKSLLLLASNDDGARSNIDGGRSTGGSLAGSSSSLLSNGKMNAASSSKPVKSTANSNPAAASIPKRGQHFENVNNNINREKVLQLVREYQSLPPNDRIHSHAAIQIESLTGYPMPGKILQARYDNATRTEFLRRVQPIVREMERRKVQDVASTKAKTRCAVRKGGGRYRYYDSATGREMDPEEYKGRYAAMMEEERLGRKTKKKRRKRVMMMADVNGTRSSADVGTEECPKGSRSRVAMDKGSKECIVDGLVRNNKNRNVTRAKKRPEQGSEDAPRINTDNTDHHNKSNAKEADEIQAENEEEGEEALISPNDDAPNSNDSNMDMDESVNMDDSIMSLSPENDDNDGHGPSSSLSSSVQFGDASSSSPRIMTMEDSSPLPTVESGDSADHEEKQHDDALSLPCRHASSSLHTKNNTVATAVNKSSPTEVIQSEPNTANEDDAPQHHGNTTDHENNESSHPILAVTSSSSSLPNSDDPRVLAARRKLKRAIDAALASYSQEILAIEEEERRNIK